MEQGKRHKMGGKIKKYRGSSFKRKTNETSKNCKLLDNIIDKWLFCNTKKIIHEIGSVKYWYFIQNKKGISIAFTLINKLNLFFTLVTVSASWIMLI